MIKNNKNNKKGYILIEIAIFVIIISMLCVSLAMVISNKITINQKDRINQNLYITAKSTINVLSEEFSSKKDLLKKYAKKNEEGTLKLENRDDIASIKLKVYENTLKTGAILEITILDNLKNELTLTTEIYY